MIKAEIVSSGAELVDGSVIDRNAAYIASRLSMLGLSVAAHYCIGDDINRLTEVFDQLGRRSDLAVVTGGLQKPPVSIWSKIYLHWRRSNSFLKNTIGYLAQAIKSRRCCQRGPTALSIQLERLLDL